MASLNKVMLIGNVGRDPEIVYFKSGDAVAKFSLATTEKWKSKEGEQKEKTEWHNVEVFGGAAEVVKNYVEKGKQLYIEGQLQTDKYEKDGVTKYSTKVVVRGWGGKLVLLGSGGGGGAKSTAKPRQVDAGDDDDLF
jgi:single-strand DNA-binding protein